MSAIMAYNGLSNVAHSIRRSVALYVAAITTPADDADNILVNAERYANWLKGAGTHVPASPRDWFEQP